ncbi:DUF4129 domain-containing protein [Hymenobacter sp. NST-14]|uniref:DUF4129 domain-containing protein n=1 Tax=Hymenobacter piscis TaxID=2839984 RepID=UPI001C00E5D2|nr:DUF4129 domain-containing protein [Hymenobacter piscis]MBT9391591.1 DUF4129 domain-containing protein [Hymenobacter piscis]
MTRSRLLSTFVPASVAAVIGLLLAAPAGAAPGPQLPRPPLLPPADTTVARSAARFVPLPADTAAPVRLRRPAAGRLAALARRPEFRYVEPEIRSSSDSAWTRFWRELLRWVMELFSGPTYERKGRYVVYALFAAAFGYVVLRLLRLDVTGLFGRRNRAVPLPYETLSEDIHRIDFTEELARAEQAGNYRLAVRLGYLLTLRHLTERHLIRWQPDKTNHDYLRELAGSPWAPGFQELTRQFEYVWYGERPLSATQYPALREARQEFIRHLSGRLSAVS